MPETTPQAQPKDQRVRNTGHIPVKDGKVALGLDEFIAEIYKRNAVLMVEEANHGDPAVANLMARTAATMKKAGADRSFIEFPQTYQKMLQAYFDAAPGSDKEKQASDALVKEYQRVYVPAPLPISKERCIAEYMEYFKQCKQEGRKPPIYMDGASLPELAAEANQIKAALEKTAKELDALGKDTPEHKKKQAELQAMQRRYEPIKEMPGLFQEIITLQGELNRKTPDGKPAFQGAELQKRQQRFGELVTQSRFEVEKVWIWRMQEEMRENPGKASVIAGRAHYEGGEFHNKVARDVAGDKGAVRVLVIQAPVLKDAIYPGKKENIPFPGVRVPKELPDFVVVTPSVLLTDTLKTDKHYQDLPQARKDALADRYEEAGKNMGAIIRFVSDKMQAGGKDIAPYQRLEGPLYGGLYLELSRGQFADARATAADMRAWVEAENTLAPDDKKKLLEHFTQMEKALAEVNADIKGVPTPATHKPARFMPARPPEKKPGEQEEAPEANPVEGPMAHLSPWPVQGLLAAGAAVTVVAPPLRPELPPILSAARPAGEPDHSIAI